MPTWMMRMMMAVSRMSTAMQPSMPSSSPMEEKIRSVCCAGIEPLCTIVPW